MHDPTPACRQYLLPRRGRAKERLWRLLMCCKAAGPRKQAARGGCCSPARDPSLQPNALGNSARRCPGAGHLRTPCQ
eukprot:7280450-Alexandrium_andersonii.AAC.1